MNHNQTNKCTGTNKGTDLALEKLPQIHLAERERRPSLRALLCSCCFATCNQVGRRRSWKLVCNTCLPAADFSTRSNSNLGSFTNWVLWRKGPQDSAFVIWIVNGVLTWQKQDARGYLPFYQFLFHTNCLPGIDPRYLFSIPEPFYHPASKILHE